MAERNGAPGVVRLGEIGSAVPLTGRKVDVHVAGAAGLSRRAGIPVEAVQPLVALGAVPDIAYPQFWIGHAKRGGVFNQDGVGHLGGVELRIEGRTEVLRRVDLVNQVDKVAVRLAVAGRA